MEYSLLLETLRRWKEPVKRTSGRFGWCSRVLSSTTVVAAESTASVGPVLWMLLPRQIRAWTADTVSVDPVLLVLLPRRMNRSFQSLRKLRFQYDEYCRKAVV
jgi:hypothetical protein